MLSRAGLALTSFAIILHRVPSLPAEWLERCLCGAATRPGGELVSSASLYKQVQGSENQPLPGVPGEMAMPEVSRRAPVGFEVNNELRDRVATEDPQPGRESCGY